MENWEAMDLADLNIAYNARESVPDFDIYARGFTSDSERVRAALAVEASVPYGPHRDQVLDVFPAGGKSGPAGDGLAPIHLFIHGGYWRMLTKDENSYVAEVLAPAGACVMVNTYSLTPSVKLDVIVHQCRAAIAWAYHNGKRFGGDPDRIYISGHSAGGHLVGMMLATDWEGDYGLPADIIKGASALSGIYDIRPLGRAFTNEWLELSPTEAERNSPILQRTPYPCPVLVAWGGAEPAGFGWQSTRYAAWLKQAGLDVTVLEMPGLDHFALCNELMNADSPLTQAVLRQMKL